MFFVLTPTAKAYSLDDLYASIQSLQQQVSSLQSQMSATVLKAVTTTVTPTPTATLTITNIKAIQSNLVLQGYLVGNVDGIIGPVTTEAITNYQRAKGLPTTGIVNTATMTSILLAVPAISVSTSQTPIPTPSGCYGSCIYGIAGVLGTPPTVTAATNCVENATGVCSCASAYQDYKLICENCPTTPVVSNLPAGCTSAVGYSTTTGVSCGCNGTVYSTYNGQLCPGATSI